MKVNLRKMFWEYAEKIYNEEYVGKMRFYYGGPINFILGKMEEELRDKVVIEE